VGLSLLGQPVSVARQVGRPLLQQVALVHQRQELGVDVLGLLLGVVELLKVRREI
jgi:hypothetical protein